ncbi:MAG: nuclear transport factor 2 family protein [Solirubrobacterales bacterium]
MPEQDFEALKRIYSGWASGNMWAEAALYDPCVVYDSQADTDPGPHYGLEALTRYMNFFLESWDDWRIEALEYRRAGDSFLVRTRRSAVGKGSGLPLEDEAFHLWTFRGGKVIRIDVYKQEAAALEAAGLSE